MTPAHVPGLAELQGRKAAAVLEAHVVLQYAAVAPAAMPVEDAVRRAKHLLLRHVLPAPAPRVWVGHRRDDDGTEWLELPGVAAVRLVP